MERRLYKGPTLCPQDGGSKTMENEWNIIHREGFENPVADTTLLNANLTWTALSFNLHIIACRFIKFAPLQRVPRVE